MAVLKNKLSILIMNINFKANYISSTYIKKILPKETKDYKASFIEIDINNPKDIDALEKVSWNWADGFTFATRIYKNAVTDNFESLTNIKPEYRYYALTEQKRNLETLNHKKILGIMQVKEIYPYKHSNTIEYLQINPNYKFDVKNSKYKKIGTALIQCLTELFPDKNIFLEATKQSLKFYEKLGFKNITRGLGMLLRVKDFKF